MIFTAKVSNKIIKNIKSKKWYRHGTYRSNILVISTLVNHVGKDWFNKEGVEKGIRDLVFLSDTAYIPETHFKEMVDFFYTKLSIDFLKNYIYGHQKSNEKIIEISRALSMKDPSRLSNQELRFYLDIYFEESKDFFHWLWSMEFLNPAFERYLRKKIKRWRPNWSYEEINNFLNFISFVPKKLGFQKESEEIAYLRWPYNKKIRKLFLKYSWLSLNMWEGKPFSFFEYRNRAKNLLNKREMIRKRVKEMNSRIKKVNKIINNTDDREIRELLLIAQELIFLKTDRIDKYSRSWMNVWYLVSEVCKRLNIKHEDLVRLTVDEVLDSLKQGKVVIDLESRKEYIAARVDNSVYLYNKFALDKIKKALVKEDYSGVTEVKGMVAYRGIARGYSKVLMSDREIYRIKKGDILICNLTNPNYNSVFNKVKAVVTEEGGLLCHSAIMAREFRIPCIVGTKIATRVFKDNDLVEVDANNGVVRKLEFS